MQYHLRSATVQDIHHIQALFLEMLQSIYGNTDVTGYKDGDLDHYFSGGEDWICVADVGGTVAGFLSIQVHREDKPFLYLDDFCVAFPYRGNGIGSALLTSAEAFATSIGVRNIKLHVESGNHTARAFYDNRSFRELHKDDSRLCLGKELASEQSRCLE